MALLEDFELRIMDLEERLRPIANRPVDITQPGWGGRLMESPHPLDQAGVRPEAESLLEELISCYRTGTDDVRNAIRRLFVQYRGFAWAANLSFDPKTEEEFRRHLVLFSMKDQGRDSRDALMDLQYLCRKAASAGVSTTPLLNEVAELCSDQNKYGMGSTKQMLLKERRDGCDNSRH